MVYDFGDRKVSEHLRAISIELADQAFINGEDQPDMCEEQSLYDLSALLATLASSVAELEGRLKALEST